MRTSVVALTALGICLGLAGCNNQETPFRKIDPNKVPITGEITYKGRPLSGAVITLEPKQKGVEGTGVEVTDGKFSLPQADGLVPGVYVVRVFDMASFIGEPGGPTGGDDQAVRVGKFPAEYSEKSTLTFKVTAEGPNHLKLDLK
jgi:hypothetical protein